MNFTFGFVLTIAGYILSTIQSTEATNAQLMPLYRLFPPYNLGEGLISMSTRSLYALILNVDSAPWDW